MSLSLAIRTQMPRIFGDKNHMPPTITYAGLTDIGRVRETNEDAFAINPKVGLMVVADGLGGHQAGEVASTFVVENLPRQLAMGRAAGMEDSQGAEQLLRQSLLMVAEQLRDMGAAAPKCDGMGATVVAGLVADTTLIIAHLGDSRAYRLRNGILERLTQDHNLGNALRDKGVIQGDAEDMPEYHMLRRFMGMDKPLAPDIAGFDLRERDRFLLCSDGLTNMLDDTDISDILMCETSCEEACSQLVTRANQAGGYDNVTVVVADVQSTQPGDESRDKVVQEMPRMDIDEVPQGEIALEDAAWDRLERG